MHVLSEVDRVGGGRELGVLSGYVVSGVEDEREHEYMSVPWCIPWGDYGRVNKLLPSN